EDTIPYSVGSGVGRESHAGRPVVPTRRLGRDEPGGHWDVPGDIALVFGPKLAVRASTRARAGPDRSVTAYGLRNRAHWHGSPSTTAQQRTPQARRPSRVR